MSEDLYGVNEKMQKSISVLKEHLSTIRAGRANPAILDRISIDYYGVPSPLKQVGNISVLDARTMVIQPWDGSMLKEIEKAIQKSDLGINPTNDGKVIRLSFPQLTEERRLGLKKDIEKIGEDSKIAIRAVRRDCIEKAKEEKKDGTLTEDDLKGVENEVQKITDKFIEEINKIIKSKSDEIMEI